MMTNMDDVDTQALLPEDLKWTTRLITFSRRSTLNVSM
jgi:hypothetical protein